MSDARLVIQKLSKSYAAPVLTDVDITVAAGEIHALVGENGAGKSTLVNILTGLTPRNAGEIKLDGKSYLPRNSTEAYAAGVSFAAQELSVINTLTVAENVGLRQLPQHRGVVDRQALGSKAKAMLERLGLNDISTEQEAGTLSLAQQQLLEIARSLVDEPTLLLLDEPTAALNATQSERLHDIIRERAAAGMSAIYISHRLQDVLDIADRISILRDGRVVASGAAADFSIDRLVALMAGKASEDAAPPSALRRMGGIRIRADAMTTARLPNPISLEAHAGEILGLAGLAGAGRSELLHALFGLDPLTGGTVARHSDDDSVRIDSATHAVREGIALVGEDRQSMGLFAGLPVSTNMMLPGKLKRNPLFSVINGNDEELASKALIEKLGIDCQSSDQDIAELSGGNQQKALIARWLNVGADVFLLDEPTRGVDVGTKHALYDEFRDLAGQGRCLILASSEIEELMAICDRIIVFSMRHIAAEFARESFSEEAILAAAFSGYSPSAAAGA